MTRRAALPLLVLAALLAVAGCAGVAPPPPAPAVGWGGPGELIARLAADEAAITTVRGLAAVRFAGPGGSGSASQVIVVALPDHARLETLTPLGTAALLLTVRGERLAVYAPLRDEYGTGRATRDALERLTSIPLPPGPLLRLLAGLPPLPLHPGDPRLQVEAELGGVRIESVDGSYWQRLWTDQGGGVIVRGELGESRGLLLRFYFGERRQVGALAFPFQMEVEGAAAGTRVALHYETVKLNEAIPAELFELPPPPNGHTRSIDLGALP
jgi:outer membrane lipoprotein-sorting protein